MSTATPELLHDDLPNPLPYYAPSPPKSAASKATTSARRTGTLDDLPGDAMVDKVVAMDEQVTKRNDPGVSGDTRHRGRIALCQAAHRLADDLEVALDALPEHAVAGVLILGNAACHVRDKGGGIADVFEEFGRVRLDRAGTGRALWTGSGRGCAGRRP